MITLSKRKYVTWGTVGFLAALLLVAASHLRAKQAAKPPAPPAVEVAQVERRDVPIYGEWIGTLAGQVNANVQAQVSGYLLRRNYQEGSFVEKGQVLFEIDPRPFQAALDQAKGQLAQANAQLVQDEAQLAIAEANQLKSQLDVEKYTPLAKGRGRQPAGYGQRGADQSRQQSPGASREGGHRSGEGSDSGGASGSRNRHDQPWLYPA